MNPDRAPLAANRNHRNWDLLYQGGGDPAPFDRQWLASVTGLPPGRALDLGCGAGGNAIGLAERGWKVTALDRAVNAIASARRAAARAGAPVDFRVADMSEWATAAEYDLTLISYALPSRGPVRDKALSAARNSLAPGGRLMIAEWDVRYAWWGSPDDYATRRELEEALAGLREVEITAVSVAREFSPAHRRPGARRPGPRRAWYASARRPGGDGGISRE